MEIDENSINHNTVRLIDSAIRGGIDEEHEEEFLISAFNYIKGICDMANAMKEVLKVN